MNTEVYFFQKPAPPRRYNSKYIFFRIWKNILGKGYIVHLYSFSGADFREKYTPGLIWTLRPTCWSTSRWWCTLTERCPSTRIFRRKRTHFPSCNCLITSYLTSICTMVPLDGYSETVAHAKRKIGLFVERIIRFVTTFDQMPYTDQITEIAPYVRPYFWVII